MIRVIGDIILDTWVIGVVDRISPEAPVPVLLERCSISSLGGAANVSANFENLNIKAKTYGAVSSDLAASEVLELFDKLGIEYSIDCSLDKTTQKTRITSECGSHLVRLDVESYYNGLGCERSLLDEIRSGDIIAISDYNKGVIKGNIVNRIVSKGCLVFSDPKQDPEVYRSSFLVKPNMKEYVDWNGEFIIDSATSFMNRYSWTWLVITDGSNGIHLLNKDGSYLHFHEEAREVADVTGAGDVVFAAIIYNYINGFDIPKCCERACFAAARNVERRGVSLIEIEELNNA